MRFYPLIFTGLAVGLAACLTTESTEPDTRSLVRSAADGPTNDAAALHSCGAPFGAVAIVDQQDAAELAKHELASPVPLLRLLAARSNCFAVVERGAALERIVQERDLAAKGLLREDDQPGSSGLIEADYVLATFIVLSDDDAGGLVAPIGKFFPAGFGTKVGALGGGLGFKEAETMLTIADQRSGIQIAVAKGHAKATDLLISPFGLDGSPGLGELGGYSDTDQGKIISAAFTDAFNNLIVELKDRPNG